MLPNALLTLDGALLGLVEETLDESFASKSTFSTCVIFSGPAGFVLFKIASTSNSVCCRLPTMISAKTVP
jgi:hypothetical protein